MKREERREREIKGEVREARETGKKERTGREREGEGKGNKIANKIARTEPKSTFHVD